MLTVVEKKIFKVRTKQNTKIMDAICTPIEYYSVRMRNEVLIHDVMRFMTHE